MRTVLPVLAATLFLPSVQAQTLPSLAVPTFSMQYVESMTWGGYPLDAAISVESTDEQVTVLRLDGTCIALAEQWVGANRAAASSMSLVVSTGVGGGIVLEGRIVSGRSGNAGHIGQIHQHGQPPIVVTRTLSLGVHVVTPLGGGDATRAAARTISDMLAASHRQGAQSTRRGQALR